MAETQAQVHAEPSPFRRPTTVAMNSAGAAAIVVGGGFDGQTDQKILIRRANGSITIVPYPRKAILAASFLAYRQPNVPANASSIRNIALADDGTPFATLVSAVNGAYFALQEAPFVWQGSSWRPALTTPIDRDASNVVIVAADTPTRWAVTLDYLSLPPSDFADRGDLDFESFLVKTGKRYRLGAGTVTGLNGDFVVGYDFGFSPAGVPQGTVQRVRALEWNHRSQTNLGEGVAWSVNALGDAVGDDRTALDEPGRPAVWHHGKQILISQQHGSAFDVNDAGAIVGALGESGFIAFPSGSSYRLVILDSLLKPRGLHISAAYRISRDGRILAVAARPPAKEESLVELVPSGDITGR